LSDKYRALQVPGKQWLPSSNNYRVGCHRAMQQVPWDPRIRSRDMYRCSSATADKTDGLPIHRVLIPWVHILLDAKTSRNTCYRPLEKDDVQP
jgi:hypothetical protein